MSPFLFIAKWFWVISIAGVFLRAVIWRVRGDERIEEMPELEEGYRKIIRGFVIWGNIPWLVMGLGCTTGNVPTVFHYFRPRDGNPFVTAFLVSVVLVWVLGTYWVFFRDGAEMLVKYPGWFLCLYVQTISPTVVKLLWCLGLAAGVVAMVLMFTKDLPVPK